MNTTMFGFLKGHSVGIIMKELVRRAIIAIRNQRQSFVATAKEGYDGKMDDVLTSADKAAQDIYVTSLRKRFPGITVIAEEGPEHSEVSRHEGKPLYFTVDPLDGTRAFVRRESSGVGTMIALVHGNDVLAAFVGDVNTQEIYGFHPDSMGVMRIIDSSAPERLGTGKRRRLSDSYAMLRDREKSHSASAQELIDAKFRGVTINAGSIGIWCARLWKGEVGAGLILPEVETPWDSAPVIGISQALGYVFLRPGSDRAWEEYHPRLSPSKYRRDHETWIIHRDDYTQFLHAK
jgi:fructose-1,6-bisphosphatase/inositol monophosphatase family enzyme